MSDIYVGFTSSTAMFLFVFSDEIEGIMFEKGLKMEVVISRKAGPEFLSILKFKR